MSAAPEKSYKILVLWVGDSEIVFEKFWSFPSFYVKFSEPKLSILF
jgi:hypothetical protein